MPEGLKQHAWLLAICSMGISITAGTAALMILINLPEDYFLDRKQATLPVRPRPNLALFLFRNILGVGIILLGVLMSLPLVPGPGLVMMIAGLSLTNFPGKRKLELKILRASLTLNAVNRLRAKRGRPPFRLPSLTGGAES